MRPAGFEALAGMAVTQFHQGFVGWEVRPIRRGGKISQQRSETDDLDNSTDFYGEKLGLEMVLDQGACRIYRTGRESFIGICRCGDQRRVAPETRIQRNAPESVIVTLVSDDVDGWYLKLKSRGVVFDAEPAENPEFHIYHCFISDPDGYNIEIQSFHDPAWPRAEKVP
jgi:catechol 2,3-dioxygenase-like lactoylglutathione lyase family enzyme